MTKNSNTEAAYLLGRLTRQALIAIILIGLGYYAGKVEVYEARSGYYKVTRGESALPELKLPNGEEMR